jgi:D-lactate dehydrogenase
VKARINEPTSRGEDPTHPAVPRQHQQAHHDAAALAGIAGDLAGSLGCMTHVVMFDTKSYDRKYIGESLAEAGLRATFRDFRLTPETVDTVGDDVDVVCVFVNDKLPRPVLEVLAGKGVKMVALRCTGFNGVDIEAAKDLGILVARVPDYSPFSVAEHAVGLLQALNRKLIRANRQVRDMNFTLDGLVGFDLNGKTAGLIGSGKIGKIAAKIFQGYGMRVVLWDPYPDHVWARATGCEYVKLDELGRDADVISLHVPLLPETHHIINALTIAEFKRGVIILNVSRGALIDTRALIEGLKSGQIGGVGLDVYEEEEGKFFEDLSLEIMDDDVLARLLSFPNVLVTAHQAFLTAEALSDIARTSTLNICDMANDVEILPPRRLA